MEILFFVGVFVVVMVASTLWQKRKIDKAREKYANDPDVEVLPGWAFTLRTKREPFVTVTPAGGGKNNPPVWRIACRAAGLAGKSSLSLSREGVLGGLREKLGFKDVHIGDEDFDRLWTIRGSDADVLRALLLNRSMQSAVGAVFGVAQLSVIHIDDRGNLSGTAPRSGLDDEQARALALSLFDFVATLDEHTRQLPLVRRAG